MKVWILNFHGIGEPHSGVEQSERPYWISEEQFGACLDVCERHRNLIEITFDDGNRSDLTVAAPALKRRQLTACFFVLSGRMHDPQYLSREAMREMRAMGMTIGLHGGQHLDWRQLSDDALHDELYGARHLIADAAGAPVEVAAIPFGHYDRRVMRKLLDARFRHVYSSDGGPAVRGRWFQPRTSIRRDTDLGALEAEIAGGLNNVRHLRRVISIAYRRHVKNGRRA